MRIVLWQDAAVCVDGEGESPPERQLRLVTSADASLGAGDRESRDPRVRQVLVVDDERSIRFLCGVNLKLAGFEVTEAATGAHALQLAKSRQFDLVLLDVMLPDIGGHEVARDLAADERTAGLPIVFVSARAARDDIRLGFELGAIDYITKPFDPQALSTRVLQAVTRVERGEGDDLRRERMNELELR